MSSPDDKRDRVIQARLRLRERFLRDAAEASAGDDAARPKLPPGQTETTKWPVLDLGFQPEIPRERWRLTIDGAVEQPSTLTYAELLALPQVRDTSDFHCVTAWSRFDLPWVGVRVADVLALAMPLPEATHLMAHGYDGYSTNVSLAAALAPDVLLVHTADGAPLAREHGGPVRMITPRLYAWKGAKWVSRLELMIGDRPGFWEERGYSMTADPWRNDRYR